MKSSVSPALAAIAIVLAIVIVGFFAYRTLGTQPAASEDLTKNADLTAIMNLTDKDKEQMKRDFEKARESRSALTK